MKEEDKLKLDAKMNELKQKRAGNATSIEVIIDKNNKSVNFQHCLNEMRKLCEMHGLIPDEVNALGSQLQWLANAVSVNNKLTSFQRSLEKQLNDMFAPKTETPEEKAAKKLAQEAEDGIVRVKPEGTIEETTDSKEAVGEAKKE